MKRAFTLIEILAAIAIIAILATLGLGTYSFAMNSARESATTSLIKQMEAGLTAAKTKIGYFPATMSGSTRSYQKITFEFNTDETLKNIKIGSNDLSDEYRKEVMKVLDLETIRKSLKDSGELEDAWGGAIFYAYPGVINKTGIDLVSPGPDGKFVNGDTAPKSSDARTLYYDGKDKICDDITNF